MPRPPRSVVLVVCAWLAIPLGALAGDTGNVAPDGLSIGAATSGAPTPTVTRGVIVKLRSGITTCLSCRINAGQAIGRARPGSRLDTLNRRFGVMRARPLLQRAAAVRSHTALTPRFAARDRRGSGAAPDLARTYLLEVRAHPNLAEVARAYEADPAVEYAEPDAVLEATLVPDDPYFSSSGAWGQSFDDLWGAKRIRAPEAWDVTRGAGVVIAIVDTGIDYDHPDLAANMWTNAGEIAGNTVDDDGNGYVDDVLGWDFAGNDADPLDDNRHGTHVAGTAAATGQNARGIVGVAFESQVMAVRALGTFGSGLTSDLAEAILYAVDNGADVINASFAGPGRSQLLGDAIAAAHAAGVVFVAAAGNAAADTSGVTPANDPNAIAVAALTSTDARAAFSSFGVKLDLGAPGGGDVAPPAASPSASILSLLSSAVAPSVPIETSLLVFDGPDTYLRLAGTSMAAPHVSGTAALMLTIHPTWSVETIRQALRASAVDLGPAGPDVDSGYGRVDAAAAVVLPEPLQAHITAPPAGEIVGPEDVEIHGSATGPGFESYTLEYARADDLSSWSTIAGPITTPVTAGLLATWDMRALDDVAYVLRLRVERGAEVFADRVPISVRNVAITTPERLSAFRTDGPIEIRGTAAGGGFEQWTLEVRRPANGVESWTTSGLTLATTSDTPVRNGLLATFDTSGFTASDRIDFRLTVTNAAGTHTRSRLGVTVDPDLRPGWPQWLVGVPDREYLTIADLDGDAVQEILVGSGNEVVVFEPDGTVRPGWPQSVVVNDAGVSTHGSPLVADVTGDAAPEVIATNREQLFVWSGDGDLLPGFPVTPPKLGTANDWVGVGDLTGDGKDEIICTGFLGMEAYFGDGTPVPGWSRSDFSMPPAIGDAVGDSRVEVAWFHNDTIKKDLRKGRISLIGPDALTLVEAKAKGGFFTHPAMADLDGDGVLDMAVLSEPANRVKVKLAAFSAATGRRVRMRPPSIKGKQNRGNGAVSFSDVDRDGRAEAWTYARVTASPAQVQEETGVFAPFESSGAVAPKLPLSHRLFAIPVFTDLAGGIAIGDVDGDGTQELVGGMVGIGCAINGVDACLGSQIRRALPVQSVDGPLMPGFPRAVPDVVPPDDEGFGAFLTAWIDNPRLGTPAIADLDNDGLKEVIWVDTLGPRVFVWNVPGTPGPLLADWPMYQHDAKHSNVLPPTVP